MKDCNILSGLISLANNVKKETLWTRNIGTHLIFIKAFRYDIDEWSMYMIISELDKVIWNHRTPDVHLISLLFLWVNNKYYWEG